MSTRIGHTHHDLVKGVSAKCRAMANNINKNTSAKTIHPEPKAGFRTPEKPIHIPIWALRICKRATLES